MAGMLPGVECARRRRLHLSSGMSDSPSHGGTRRSSLCLYTSSHETHHSSTSPMRKKSLLSQASQDEELESGAREAKERLDGRFKAQRKSETNRRNNKDRLGSMFQDELPTELLGSKQSRSKKFSWAKFSWKALDQNICAACI
ncbi:uncharacterized protein LOC132184773 [Corylus avellana]|uniref:uncharacterized protein LOC132184773 n=1 Tax=Corylus avellana TaxID=13451 RepID=UPI001E229E4F|nr:uncharacterized protein LOC132184773 [Corylus avellana]